MLCHFKNYIHSKKMLCIQHMQQTVTFSDFWEDVCVQANVIEQSAAQTWALWENDSYEFLVLFFAALIAKRQVILAPNRVKDLEEEFALQQIYFLARANLDSCKKREPCESLQQQTQTSDSIHTPSNLVLDDDFLNQAQLYFYTSGSTGQPKKIPRTLKQLLNEVQGLEDTLSLAEEAIAIATVSHQHIYGLLFKLLWPLASGRSFYHAQMAFPEDVVNLQKTLLGYAQPYYVISSPALLKRWTQDVALVQTEAMFSSGGKLDAGIRPHLNVAITEIFGSSETGGIAYRQLDDALWTPFSNVEIQVSDSGELAIRSSHAFEQDWIYTGDQVQLATSSTEIDLNVPEVSQNMQGSKQFKLLGRVDRIVKLEEKRLSLDAIEQKILSLAQVEQCHVLLLEHEHRQILACVAVLNETTRQQLSAGAKLDVVTQLKSALKDKLETIAIPRQWRFLSQLPQNSQSKLNKTVMKDLFTDLNLPVITNYIQQSDTLIYQLEFIPELAGFKGHFRDFPVYPGVGQISFIQHFAKQHWTDLQWCNGYEQLKFQDLIRPYMVLSLRLTRQNHKVLFELKLADKNIASGRLLFQVNEQLHPNTSTAEVGV